MKTFREWLESQQSVRFAPSVGDWEQDTQEEEEEKYQNQNWLYQHDRPIDNHYDDVEKIYTNYERAMNRRRLGSALDFDSFLSYIYQDETYNFRIGDSLVFGSYKNGIFFPSHFAPSSLKEGKKIFEELQKYRVVLAVTEDLSDMAQSLGFIKVMSKVPIHFRDSLQHKDILVSNRSIIPEIKKMYSNYVN